VSVHGRKNRMITEPITTFQNPATIQGKVTAKQEKRRQIGCACSKEVMASHSPAGGADYRL
jgi:hypothetical protein